MRAVTPARLTGITVGFGAVGMALTGWLVLSELFREPTCPSLLGIPACYIVVGAYVAATCGAWCIDTRAGNARFLVGTWLIALVGLWFSASQLMGAAECPSFEGLPICYVSLLAGATMLGADLLRRRLRSSPSSSTA